VCTARAGLLPTNTSSYTISSVPNQNFRTPLLELLEAGGLKAVEAKMLEVFRKASLAPISPGER
jgi:hypothetical protein